MTPDCRSLQDTKYAKCRLGQRQIKFFDSNGNEDQNIYKETDSIYYEQQQQALSRSERGGSALA